MAAGSEEVPFGQTVHDPVPTSGSGLGFRVEGADVIVLGMARVR